MCPNQVGLQSKSLKMDLQFLEKNPAQWQHELHGEKEAERKPT